MPIPPLKPWQSIPVPPPTEPSATGPRLAPSSALNTCSCRTWNPSTSFRTPSYVSATTGRLNSNDLPRFSAHAISASRTVPTLLVVVSSTGPYSSPDSFSQCVPVISPFPFSTCVPPNTGASPAFPRGHTAVTPDRTGPFPTTSFPSPK